MPIFVKLVDENGVLLHVNKVGPHTHLVTEDHARVDTQFVDITHTSNATTTIIKPKPGGALVVVDVVLTGEKINGGLATVQFQDGSNQAIIAQAHVTDGPVNLAIPFSGRMRGWKDAFVEFVTSTTNQDATALVTFKFLRGGGVVSRADWLTEQGTT